MSEKRCTEDMKLWLFDLAHSNLPDDEVLKGFVKYYVLYNLCLGRVHDDLVFKTGYSLGDVSAAIDRLKKLLQSYAGVQDDCFELDIDKRGNELCC